MNCKEFNRRIPGYLAGEEAEPGQGSMREHAAACAACRRELEEVGEAWSRLGVLEEERPGPRVRARFYEMLERETRRAKGAAAAPRPAWQPALLQLAAAALLFAVGIGTGVVLRRPAAAPEVGGLRDEVAGLRRTLAATLIGQPSASDRLRGIHLLAPEAGRDPQATRALLQVLDEDPSVNLRLSALDTLAPLAGRADVRAAMLDSLETQSEPLLQANLAGLLARSGDEATAARLRRWATDPDLNQDVRRHLQGVLQMSV